MKKNDWIFAFSVLAYSFLFWKQAPGLNFLIMNILLLAGMILKDKTVLKSRTWLLSAAGALVSAGAVAWYGEFSCILANAVSLLLVSAFVLNRQNSLLVVVLHSVCNAAVSVAYMILDGIERRKKRMEVSPGRSVFGKRFLIVLIALLVVLVFFFMYRSSNILFDQLAAKINLDFISVPWIFFTLIGAIVIYAFYYHHPLPGVSEWENRQAIDLHPSEELSPLDRMMSISSERFSGIVLLSLLNLLLLVVNGLDAVYLLSGSKDLPGGVTYTQYVHQGVGMLITSILLAMAIILFYFRGRLNFIEKGGALRALAIGWILQNAFMLFSTVCRNEMYVEMFGLTYKRIGVYIYLLLTMIGLFTTAYKVIKRKTNAFLFRSNAWLFYGVMILACPFNFDAMIARYNSTVAVQPDMNYLATLSFRAYPALFSRYEKQQFENIPDNLLDQTFFFMSFTKETKQQGKWPSTIFSAAPVFEFLNTKPAIGKASYVNVANRRLKHVWFFQCFANASSLDLSSNDLNDMGELGQYHDVKILLLDGNENLETVSGVESMYNLEELYLRNTKVTNYSPLLGLSHLKKLYVESMSNEWMARLENRFPGIDIQRSRIVQ